MYEIEFSIRAAKVYLKLPQHVRQLVDMKLSQIAKNPYAKNNNVKPLKNMKGCYRLRVADWRIVYEIIDKKLKIYIINIGQRKDIYN